MCNKEIQQKLVDSKVDEYLAQHISHLFIRDSLALFLERIHQDDEREMDHFEVGQTPVAFFSFRSYVEIMRTSR